MERRRIGDLEVSIVGLGCNNLGARLDEEGAQSLIDEAWDLGVTYFDTAESYAAGASESILGRALGTRRKDAVIATKFGRTQPDEAVTDILPWIEAALHGSLQRLGTDYVDLYYIHRFPLAIPIADVLGALNELVLSGKVRAVGCSNFTAEQLRDAAAAATGSGMVRFSAIQNEYSLLHREPESGLIPTCGELGVAFVPYFPLASGLLTGKYRAGSTPPDGSRLQAWGRRGSEMLAPERLEAVERYARLAEQQGRSLLELALAYLAGAPSVATVLAGAMSVEQIRSNVAAITSRPLTARERGEVQTVS